MPSNAENPPFVAVGRVLKTHGYLGWVKVEKLTVNPRRFSEGNTFTLQGREKEKRLVLEGAREAPDALLVKFKGFDSREAAAHLAGKLLLVVPSELGDSPPDSFWEHQLIGLRVRTEDGYLLGEITEILETGSNDVLVVQGLKEHLIPMIGDVVTHIDLQTGVMVVRAVPGLLED
jgi:16S rRNA processing protein RimM